MLGGRIDRSNVMPGQRAVRVRAFDRRGRLHSATAPRDRAVDGDHDHGADDRDDDARDVQAGDVGNLQDGPGDEASDDRSNDAEEDRLE